MIHKINVYMNICVLLNLIKIYFNHINYKKIIIIIRFILIKFL